MCKPDSQQRGLVGEYYVAFTLTRSESHIELNRDIVACNVWNEDTIKARAIMLADKASAIWK